MKQPLKAALESISFQSAVFFNELTSIYLELKREKTENIPGHALVFEMESVIKHHTGLNIKMDFGIEGPCVTTPRVNKNHPFLDELSKNYLDTNDIDRLINKANGVVRGTVDLKSGFVTGVFAEILSTISIPLVIMDGNKFIPEELAAITLHEIGHLITCYEFVARSVATNQILSALSRSMASTDGAEKKTAVLIAAHKALQLKPEGVENLAKSNNAEVVNAVVISKVIDKTRGELGANLYDINSWEYLADEYAARHQAGKHLITAFDKIYRGSFNKSFRGTGLFIGMEALKLLLIAAGIATGIGGLITISAICIAVDISNPHYDEPEYRIKRVRNQIVENLKDKKLSKDDILRLNEDLEAIDSILKNVNDRRQFFGVLFDWLTPTGRRNRSEMLLQQELESIANNALWEKAAQFKTLQ